MFLEYLNFEKYYEKNEKSLKEDFIDKNASKYYKEDKMFYVIRSYPESYTKIVKNENASKIYYHIERFKELQIKTDFFGWKIVLWFKRYYCYSLNCMDNFFDWAINS